MGLGGRQGQSFTQWPPSVVTWGPLSRAGDSNTPGLPALLDKCDHALVPGAYDWELGALTTGTTTAPHPSCGYTVWGVCLVSW